MSSNINIQITHALRFLNDLIDTSEDLYDDTKDVMYDILDVDRDEEEYNMEVRKIAKKFRDSVDDDIEDIVDDYKLFISNFSDIKSNKHSDEVVYSLKKFKSFSDDAKELIKKYDVLSVKIDSKIDDAYAKKEYVKCIALSNIFRPMKKVREILTNTKKRCDDLINKEDKE